MSYYAPLNTLKPIGQDIWIVDGPDIRFFGLPFSTRMTVIRLKNGEIFLHSPTKITKDLHQDIAALGPVKYLISPNWIHYAYIADWAKACPGARSWAAPNVRKRAKKHGNAVRFDHDLADTAPDFWAKDITQMLVKGSRVHQEVVFFHRASRTLILTDLIENFEADAVPFWFRPIARLAGIMAPNGQMPVDMWMTFRRRQHLLKSCVEKMIEWQPDYVVVAHGACFSQDCEAALRRSFRRVLG